MPRAVRKHSHELPLWVRLELPTWLLIITVYGGWVALTWHFHALPWWLVLAIGSALIALHSSLQHEASHFHPGGRMTSTVVGMPPLSLITPFPLYRQSHLQHHNNAQLTHPHRDPESYYLPEAEWQALPRFYQWLLLANQTLPGRMVLGPPLYAIRLIATELARLMQGDYRHVPMWLQHGALVALVLAWVIAVCGISFAEYVMLFVYPGLALITIRSFYEHRYHETPEGRSVIVEAGLLMRLLFLNNNYHAVHHAMPHLPWFALRQEYLAHKAYYQEQNRGFVFAGYGRWWQRFSITPVFRPVHPVIGNSMIQPSQCQDKRNNALPPEHADAIIAKDDFKPEH